MAAQALFTRSPARTAAAVLIWALLAPVARADSGPAEQLQQLLASGELARTDNPVAANFFIEQGRGVLPAVRIVALEWLPLARRTLHL